MLHPERNTKGKR